MKNKLLIPATCAILLILASFIIAPATAVAQDSQKAKSGLLIPADLQPVIKNSCMPCHSSGAKGLAKSRVNFSNWETSKPSTLVKKGKAICKMITKDKMPPAQFRESSPELALTPAQKEAICKWVNEMKPVK